MDRAPRPPRRSLRAAAPHAAVLGGAALLAVLVGQNRADAAQPEPEALCRAAIERAAARHDAPPALLRAIALVESGRRVGESRAPWPWTVNAEGEGRWFDTRSAAEAFVRARQEAGARSIDIGCLQINHYWHGRAFARAEDMFDPEANADYAARFLRALYDETGDWMTAAGYYHSRTPEHFERYSARLRRVYAEISDAPTALAAAEPTPAAPPPPLSEARWRGLIRKAAGGLLAPAQGPLLRRASGGLAAPTSASSGGGATPGAVALAAGLGARAPLLRPAEGRLLDPARPLFDAPSPDGQPQ